MNHWAFSPFLIPLGAFAVAIVAIVSGIVGQAHSRRVKAEQRMAMLSRGVPLHEIEALLTGDSEHEGRLPSDPRRRLASTRTAATVLISVGLGVVICGAALSLILRERDVLAVCAAGVIPVAIGLGFLADYRMQHAEMLRTGGPLE